MKTQPKIFTLFTVYLILGCKIQSPNENKEEEKKWLRIRVSMIYRKDWLEPVCSNHEILVQIPPGSICQGGDFLVVSAGLR